MSRIEPLENPEGKVKELYDHYLEKHKAVPEWVKVMAWAPNILLSFHDLFFNIMKSGALDERLKWHLAYTVSELNKCDFCVSVTKQMLLSMGADPEKLVLKEVDLELSNELHELAVEGTKHSYRIDEELFNDLSSKLSHQELIEAVSVIGLFNYINRFNNLLMIEPK